ncbi:hypothetical protein VB002_07720 [Campylobacter concisus]
MWHHCTIKKEFVEIYNKSWLYTNSLMLFVSSRLASISARFAITLSIFMLKFSPFSSPNFFSSHQISLMISQLLAR